MGLVDPKRDHRSVHDGGKHIGYVTVISYPGRDLTAFAEGSPHSELVVAERRERHVALFQRYKEHWLIQCGTSYGTTERNGDLNDARVMTLAAFALTIANEPDHVRTALLKEQLDGMLPLK